MKSTEEQLYLNSEFHVPCRFHGQSSASVFSLKEETLLKALEFAKSHTKVLKKDIDVIRHARKSLLFNKNLIRKQ